MFKGLTIGFALLSVALVLLKLSGIVANLTGISDREAFICGIDLRRQLQASYDTFGPEPPTATIDPSVIFGIFASLDLLMKDKKYLLQRFHAKSASLRYHFANNIGEDFEIVESLSSEMNRSNFLALKPRDGRTWKEIDTGAFWDKIREAGIDLTLIESATINASTWWVRISFPYFLQLHSLKYLIKQLNRRVEATVP